MVPQAEFKITGEIEDFTRVDNIYRTMKREGEKLLKNWKVEFKVNYVESEGDIKDIE